MVSYFTFFFVPSHPKLQLGSTGSLNKALLSLLEVDDVPDGVEVLQWQVSAVQRKDQCRKTYVSLDVEVLEVESVLPDVDADDGDMGQERVLVGGRRQLKTLGGRVQALSQTVSRP